MSSGHFEEVVRGERFEFGANWARFLKTLNDDRIREAEKSLKKLLQMDSLAGKSFLDIGSGSGLFSLAARRLGAKVHSLDYDPESVACTASLKSKFFADDSDWVVESGSVLDKDYMSSLGQYDIVYSWGVLHHTGDMMTALDHAGQAVKENGKLSIAIYNDQDGKSRRWRYVKQLYCKNVFGRIAVLAYFIPYFTIETIISGLVLYRNPLGDFIEYKRFRGMSRYHDWIDWLGGLPFEVARPELIISFYKDRGFGLESLVTSNGLGCNEYVFQRNSK